MSEPTERWTAITTEDIGDYLALFTGRGSGNVRSPELQRVTVSYTPDPGDPGTGTLRADVTDSRNGRWRLHLTGARIADTYQLDDDDSPDVNDLLPAIEHGLWEVHDSAKCIYGVGRAVNGRNADDNRATLRARAAAHLASDTSGTLRAYRRSWASAHAVTVTFTGLTGEQCQLDRPEGSCPACGGTTFTLTARAHLPIRLAEDGSYQLAASTAAAALSRVKVENTLAHLTCTGCGTRLDDGIGQVDMKLGRAAFTRQGVTLATLLRAGAGPNEAAGT